MREVYIGSIIVSLLVFNAVLLYKYFFCDYKSLTIKTLLIIESLCMIASLIPIYNLIVSICLLYVTVECMFEDRGDDE